MSGAALDYLALAGIALFLAAYVAAGLVALIRWLTRAPRLAAPSAPYLGAAVVGALLPQVISFFLLLGAVRVGAADKPWFVPTAVVLVSGLGVSGAMAALAWRASQPAGQLGRLITLLALFAVGVGASMVWVQTHQTRVFPGGDAPAYDQIGLNLLAGLGFTLGSEGTPLVARAAYEPTMHREPFYPVYVALYYALFGASNWDAVALSQVLLMGMLAVLTYFAVRQALGETSGIVAGLFTGASPDHGDLARQVMTEPLFVPVFVSAVACALLAIRTGRQRWYVAAGAGFALASLVRVFASVFFPVFAVLWLLFALRSGGRQAAKGVLVAAAVFVLVLSPWLVRNTLHFGVPFVAGRYGTQFLPRALKADAPPEMWLKWGKAALYAATTPLSELVYPIERFQYGPAVWQNEVWDFHVNDANATYKRADRECGGGEFVESEACLSRLGLTVALSHLPQYAGQTVFEFVKFNFYPFPSALAAYRNSLVWVALVTGIALLVRRRLRGPSLWLFLLLATYVGLSVQIDAWERFAMPLLPLYYGFAAAGILGVISRVALALQFAAPPPEALGLAAPGERRSVHPAG